MNHFEYRYLKAFLLTAKFKSFSLAADKLSIAQSAVSRQVKLLEDILGKELIIRSSKRVLLTDYGEKLYKMANQFDVAIVDLFENEDHKIIRVGILHGLLENWFIDVIVKYYQNSENNLDIQIDNLKNLKSKIEMGGLDIVFTTENIQSDLISSLRLFSEKLVCISKRGVEMSKLDEYRWIVYNSEDHLFKLSKNKSRQILKVNSVTTIINLVRKNMGIAVVPDHLVNNDETIQKAEIAETDGLHIYLATLNFKIMPKYLARMISAVKSQIF